MNQMGKNAHPLPAQTSGSAFFAAAGAAAARVHHIFHEGAAIVPRKLSAERLSGLGSTDIASDLFTHIDQE